MNNVDLIPSDYSRFQILKSRVRLFLFIFPAIVFIIICGKFWLNHLITTEQKKATTLQNSAASIQAQKTKIDALNLRKKELQKRLTLFQSLRGGPAIERMFVIIDTAINPNIWLTNWVFLRSGEGVKANQTRGKSTGYFIVIPKGSKQQKNSAWQSGEHMKLYGQAKSFADLAEFIKSFKRQPEVEDVLVQQTRLQENSGSPSVSFSLIVVFLGEVNE